MAQDLRHISGAAAYRERMALSPDAELVITATGFQGSMLAHDTQTADGQQVPWPFTLNIPTGVKAEIQLAIMLDHNIRWASEPLAVSAGADDIDLGTVMLASYVPPVVTNTVTCGGRQFQVEFNDNTATFEADDRIFQLPEAVSASGAKYASEDGKTVFWGKGDQASMVLNGEELPECVIEPNNNHASWQAQGNEPGWQATITHDRLSLNLNYGDDQLDLRLPQPQIIDGAYHYTFPLFGLDLAVRELICQDNMSGRLFPQTVELKTASQSFNGCGGDTLALISGSQWQVDAIDGTAVIAGEPLSITINDEGHISGAAGCNRYMGKLAINGEGNLTIGPLASTNMACDEALMLQELAFLRSLDAVQRFSFAENGDLLLIAPDGKTLITAHR